MQKRHKRKNISKIEKRETKNLHVLFHHYKDTKNLALSYKKN